MVSPKLQDSIALALSSNPSLAFPTQDRDRLGDCLWSQDQIGLQLPALRDLGELPELSMPSFVPVQA